MKSPQNNVRVIQKKKKNQNVENSQVNFELPIKIKREKKNVQKYFIIQLIRVENGVWIRTF